VRGAGGGAGAANARFRARFRFRAPTLRTARPAGLNTAPPSWRARELPARFRARFPFRARIGCITEKGILPTPLPTQARGE